MSDRIENFVKAYMALNAQEKKEAIKIIKTIETGSEMEKKAISESLGIESATTINFAPTPGRCPACGR